MHLSLNQLLVSWLVIYNHKESISHLSSSVNAFVIDSIWVHQERDCWGLFYSLFQPLQIIRIRVRNSLVKILDHGIQIG